MRHPPKARDPVDQSDRSRQEDSVIDVFGGRFGGEARGRLLEEQRRRRMTRRGRVTLLTLFALAAVFGFAVVRSGDGASRALASAPDLPAVGASARPLRGAPEAPSEILTRLPASREALALARVEGSGGVRYVEAVDRPPGRRDLQGPLRVEYSFEPELTERVFRVLRRGRVKRGHAILMDPTSGRVLTYASTDSRAFPGEKPYPAASLVKVVTAAAVLDRAPRAAETSCRYTGNPYRLRPSHLKEPRRGREITLESALATSNNHCFARFAVNRVGGPALIGAIARFGWLEAPAPGHAAGTVVELSDDYDLGRLGCGLRGCRITPLHAVQLAASLANGKKIEPHWVERVIDDSGRVLRMPEPHETKRVMSQDLADELRAMLVRTTTRGTARSAFRDRRGRPRLGEISVAGKTGNLSGQDPKGRYEWFIGLVPAEAPQLAIAVVQLHDDLWWRTSSQLAADVLVEMYCERGECSRERAARWIDPSGHPGEPDARLAAKPAAKAGKGPAS